MLLCRITEHVQDQNWFAVLIDFFIVVIGVYVGIQVSNWNEERRDAARAGEYLARLHADLTEDVTRFERRHSRNGYNKSPTSPNQVEFGFNFYVSTRGYC